jgi:hypothetical protein
VNTRRTRGRRSTCHLLPKPPCRWPIEPASPERRDGAAVRIDRRPRLAPPGSAPHGSLGRKWQVERRPRVGGACPAARPGASLMDRPLSRAPRTAGGTMRGCQHVGRRDFLKSAGLGLAAIPALPGLRLQGLTASASPRRARVALVRTPDRRDGVRRVLEAAGPDPRGGAAGGAQAELQLGRPGARGHGPRDAGAARGGAARAGRPEHPPGRVQRSRRGRPG